MENNNRRKYECKDCDGDGIIQSENGDKSVECPKCQGTGTYNPYE
jgi:DnaJ-class molecular chaperone